LDDPFAVSSRKLAGVVVDDLNATLIGAWKPSTANRRFVDRGYQHNDNQGQGEKSATFQARLSPGRYEVRLSYPPNRNRATNVPVTVVHAGGRFPLRVNQRQEPPIDGLFRSLGTFEFGQSGTVVVDTADTDGHVIIDAVQFLPK
jgi:hypothetical protein